MRNLSLFFILFATSLQAEEEFNTSGQISQMFLSLGGILVVIFIISFVFKRLMNRRVQVANDSGIIKILERRALNPKCALYVIEVKGKTMVIGESPHGLSSLGIVSEEEVLPELPPKPAKPSFASILRNLTKSKVSS